VFADGTRVTALDLRQACALERVHINDDTSLKTLTLPSPATSLVVLELNNTRLTHLDLSAAQGFTGLQLLSLAGGLRTALDVSALGNLVELYVNDNQLTALDLNANTKLRRLNLADNPGFVLSFAAGSTFADAFLQAADSRLYIERSKWDANNDGRKPATWVYHDAEGYAGPP
jgi:hypothetical protein